MRVLFQRTTLPGPDNVAFAIETTHQPVNLKQLTEEERVLCDAAIRKEFDKFEKYGIFKRVPAAEAQGKIIMPSMLVLTKKLKQGKRVFKARLVALGNRDKRQDLDTKTGACTHDTARILMLAAISHPNFDRTQILQLDMVNAYLQAAMPAGEAVYVCPPQGHPDHGTGKL